MTKSKVIRLLFQQSPFLAFSAKDFHVIDRRFNSAKSLYVRFAYQWKDKRGQSRRNLSIALKNSMNELLNEIKNSIPGSKLVLNYASLRAQAGKPVLHKIVLDLLSSDLLFFDLTIASPNVLFELGIAYATNANIFLLLREGAERALPSDLAGLTYCRYTKGKKLSFDSFPQKDIKRAMKIIVARKSKLKFALASGGVIL